MILRQIFTATLEGSVQEMALKIFGYDVKIQTRLLAVITICDWIIGVFDLDGAALTQFRDSQSHF